MVKIVLPIEVLVITVWGVNTIDILMTKLTVMHSEYLCLLSLKYICTKTHQ